MPRTTFILLAAAAVVIPAGGVWAATHATTRPATATATGRATATAAARKTATVTAHKTATATARKRATSKAHKKTTTHTYAGPSEDMEWGPVQVSIVVKGKHITDVTASAPTERSRSAFINEQALPMLRQEVLQAQNASIDLISGATLTSEAYDASLQAAIDRAHKAHTL